MTVRASGAGRRTPELAILVVVLAGIIARFIVLHQRLPLWGDEAMLGVGIWHLSGPELLQPLPYFQIAPPFFLALAKLATSIGGVSEFWLRVPAFLGGAAALILIALLAFETGGRRLAMTTTALAAFSAILIRYSVEVKPYVFDAAFGAAAPLLTLRIRRDSVRYPRASVIGLSALVAVGSTAAPVLVGGLVAALLASREVRQRVGLPAIAIAAATGGALFLCCYLAAYRPNATAAAMTGFWGDSFIAIGHPGAWRRLVGAAQAFASTLPSFAPLAREARLVGIIVAGVALIPKVREIGVALVAPALLALLLSGIAHFPIAPRLVLYALPSMLLAIAALIVAAIPDDPADWRRALWPIVVVIVVAFPALSALPVQTPLIWFVLVLIGGWLIVPRLPAPARFGALALAAAIVALPGALGQLRHPLIEDGRTTVMAILAAPVDAIYIPAASAPAWLFYSAHDPRDARTSWYLAQGGDGSGSAPFGEAAPRTALPPGVWRGAGRAEVLGTWSGVVYHYPEGYLGVPSASWAEREVARIDEAANTHVVMLDLHPTPGTIERLVAELERDGWRSDSVRREKTASATFLTRGAHAPAP